MDLAVPSRITSGEEFAEYLPQLFLNSVTGNGAYGFNDRFIGPVPLNSSGIDMIGVTYAGTLLRFFAEDISMKRGDTRFTLPGIVTSIEINSGSMITGIRADQLGELLNDPTSAFPRNYRRPSRASSLFLPAIYEGGRKTISAPLSEGLNFTGKTQDFWKSFEYQVAQPLKKLLWPQ